MKRVSKIGKRILHYWIRFAAFIFAILLWMWVMSKISMIETEWLRTIIALLVGIAPIAVIVGIISVKSEEYWRI